MTDPDPAWVASTRRRDLLLTLVLIGLVLTPAWLLPPAVGLPWMVVVGLLAVPAVWASWQHAPWQPTPRSELERIVRVLELSPDEAFCDLGAGDGRLVQWVHRATGARCVGLEIAPLLWLLARVRLGIGRDAGAEVRLADLYRTDLSPFDAVYVWGTAYSVGTPGFANFLDNALRPGTRIVSYHTPIPGLDPHAVDTDGPRPLYTYVR